MAHAFLRKQEPVTTIAWRIKAGTAPFGEPQAPLTGLVANHLAGQKQQAEALADRIRNIGIVLSNLQFYGTHALSIEGKALLFSVVEQYHLE